MTGERRDLGLLLAFWLAVSAAMTWLSWANISQRQFPDPDDIMRLLQVRDWLAGQSWFDVTQYRLNPPAGAPMHWSRLVDIPIAAVILITRPLFGQEGAETAALIVVPLLTLGIAMILLYRIGSRLMSSRVGLIAAFAAPLSLGVLKQMRPLRIDHHGWQIVLALTAILAALDERPRRSGLIAGAALALWMNISIEGLPFAAAVGALFAWQWLSDPNATERLKSYLAALAIVSVLAFGLTHAPSTWASQPHDVVTLAHLVGFTAAAAGSAILVRPSLDKLQLRLGALALLGLGALATMFATDPHWLQGPFASLDPLIREFWYYGTDEGLPMWRIGPYEDAMALAQPLVGLAGVSVAVLRQRDRRNVWFIYGSLLLAATLASVFVIRWATTASVLALPATALLCELALRRARSLTSVPVRVVATTASICVMTPAYAFPVSVMPQNPRFEHAVTSVKSCTEKKELDRLGVLPAGLIAAPLDITPAIILLSPHKALASGHHRNREGMLDVIRLFLFSPDQGKEIIERRHADYVVFCPHAPESIRYSVHGPHGLAAMLETGRSPPWLEPVHIPGVTRLQVFRVRRDLTGPAASS